MNYNVFGGTLNRNQSINPATSCLAVLLLSFSHAHIRFCRLPKLRQWNEKGAWGWNGRSPWGLGARHYGWGLRSTPLKKIYVCIKIVGFGALWVVF